MSFFSDMKSIYLTLPKERRRQFLILEVEIGLLAMFEVAGVVSIAPFLALVTGKIDGRNYALTRSFIDAFCGGNYQNFLIATGAFCLLFLMIVNIFTVYSMGRLATFCQSVGARISESLFEYYFCQGILFHYKNHGGFLAKNIINEVDRFTSNVLFPLMQVIGRTVVTLIIIATMFFLQPMVTLIAGIFFVVAYAFILLIVQKRFARNGRIMTDAQAKRFKILIEGFAGNKTLKLLHAFDLLLSDFKGETTKLAASIANNHWWGVVPRYMLETCGYMVLITILMIMIFLNMSTEAMFSSTIMMGILGYKLLPAFQQIYTNIALFKGNIEAYHQIRGDLLHAGAFLDRKDRGFLSFKESFGDLSSFELRDISFSYPGTDRKIISGLSARFAASGFVGIAGPSGSGKSTFLDIVSGLFAPDNGEVVINGQIVSPQDLSRFNDFIGYVPQETHIFSASVAENVALGKRRDELDVELVHTALAQVGLTKVVKDLELGIWHELGERGAGFSGGQKQRLGVARALYRQPQIIMLDESTSNLDFESEIHLMEVLKEVSRTKLILFVTHRRENLKYCDRIIEFGKSLPRDAENGVPCLTPLATT